MRAAIGILLLGLLLFLLCGILIRNEQRKSDELRQKYENLKAIENAYLDHMNECDSTGIYFFKKHGIKNKTE